MIIKKNIYCMYAVSLLQGMVFYAPIASLYRQQMGLNVFQITLIESISLIFTIILEIPWGMIADKIGYRKTMIVCSFLFFISKIIFWQANGFIFFLMERLLLSIVISGLSGVDSSLLYLSCAKDKAQQIFAIYQQLGTIGLLFASAVYSFIIKDNYRLAAFLTMLCYGIAILFTWIIQEVHDTHEQQKIYPIQEMGQIIKKLFKNKGLLFFLIGMAFINETHQTITVFLNQLQYIVCGMSNQMIGIIYIIMTLSGLLGCFSKQFTDWLKINNTLKLLIFIPFISCIVLGFTQQAVISVIAILFIHMSYQLLAPLQLQIQTQEVSSKLIATELSVNAMVMDSLAVITNLIFGKVADTSLSSAFFLGAFFCLVAYILCIFYLKQRKLNSVH